MPKHYCTFRPATNGGLYCWFVRSQQDHRVVRQGVANNSTEARDMAEEAKDALELQQEREISQLPR